MNFNWLFESVSCSSMVTLTGACKPYLIFDQVVPLPYRREHDTELTKEVDLMKVNASKKGETSMLKHVATLAVECLKQLHKVWLSKANVILSFFFLYKPETNISLWLLFQVGYTCTDFRSAILASPQIGWNAGVKIWNVSNVRRIGEPLPSAVQFKCVPPEVRDWRTLCFEIFNIYLNLLLTLTGASQHHHLSALRRYLELWCVSARVVHWEATVWFWIWS